MDITLPLDQMTTAEKLRAMEALWDDLCQHEESLPVHEWQQEILDQRERLIEEGKARFVGWEEAKKRIGKQVS